MATRVAGSKGEPAIHALLEGGSSGSHDREMASSTPGSGVRNGDHRGRTRVRGTQIDLRPFLDGLSVNWSACGRGMRNMPQGCGLQGNAPQLRQLPQ